ncbi:GGDEF domain-containing protein [Vibrio sp. VB16]|uniref:GGDEF domain-containing protein n=1 Tax=Vibrio sp. VB16 TaxID=2785746 RepID=UPI00189ED900|nr:GGDEF domain-containing protein [Vibrio sp. VB16]UGA56231.1 GGDEF domain-containing protein [Vibrio sp. VB16]
MQSFQWDKNFETGIKEVDEQHLYLVKLVNKYGELTTQNDFSILEAKRALKELSDYTSYHFHEEENLMKRVGISQGHFEGHCQSHQKFIDDVKEFSESLRLESDDLSKQLLDFLVQWLVYHILGSDQNMARQLIAIENGLSSAQAFENEEREHDEAIGPLLTALKTLFEQVSARNKELILLNLSLEDKVEQRTQELSLANEMLQELSYSDTLTKLPNRRFAMREISMQWDKARAEQLPLVCMLVDVDKFKQVNDTCGHDAGDAVLVELSTVLKRSFRPQDSVCRLGGDEFIVICPEIDLQQGLALAQTVHEQVNKIRLPYDGYCWEGSISVGVAALCESTKDVSDLIKLADDSVYMAKNAGKNCVRTIQ